MNMMKNNTTEHSKKPFGNGKILLIYFSTVVIICAVYLLRLWTPLSATILLYIYFTSYIPIFLASRYSTHKNIIILIYFVFFTGFILFTLLFGLQWNPILTFLILSAVLIGFSEYIYKTQDVITKLQKISGVNLNSKEIKDEYKKELIEALLKTIDAKDSYTYKHSKRVEYYSKLLATAINLPAEEAEYISIAGVLHDIGKIGMKESILNKDTKLTDDEYSEMKDHPIIGARIASNLSELDEIAPIIFFHHEWFDGTGYPERRVGEDIPIGSRIIALADSFDAMTSDREYRKGFHYEEALERLMKNMGTQYDPQLCIAFVDLIRNKGLIHPDISSD